MYNVWVPVMNRKLSDEQKQKLIFQLKRIKPQMVMLVYWRVMWDKKSKLTEKELFLENKKFLNDAGFTVGAWLAPTIGYGSAPNYIDNNAPFTHIKKFDSNDMGGAFCPLDDCFTDDFCDTVKSIADTGVQAIMFEDDFTFTGGKTPAYNAGCCCEKHLQKYSELLGESVKRESLAELIYKNGANRYRKVWFDMQGEILKEFCKKIEKAAHSVNPNVRIGLSANSSSYIQEGIEIHHLARIIAGKTTPFIRLTGAPYWKNLPSYSTNIDAIRLQCEWCGEGIELVTEGDTFPRPRHWVPSSLLEIYDMVLRAEGKSHTILKYMLDYSSDADYETGYIDRHLLNSKTYNEIEKRFTGNTVGLRIFEYPRLLEQMEFNEDFPLKSYGKGGYLPLVSQQFIGDNSIPTTYQKSDGATLVFGENAKYIDNDTLNNGVILDATAAKILFNRGIDVGITSYERISSPTAEYFKKYNDRTTATTEPDSVFYNFSLKNNAAVLSEFACMPKGLGIVPSISDEKQYPRFPACFKYENSNGQRFMIYSFAAKTVIVDSLGWNSGVFRSYLRQKQLTEGIEWLQKGVALPCMCEGNPSLYILCKQDGNKLNVGVWNIFPDEVLTPKFKLNKNYTHFDGYNCSGIVEGNTVYLDKPISPYGFVFFSVEN